MLFHFRTFVFTLNLIMFGITCITISYMAGIFAENKRISIASIPANCNMAVGSKTSLSAIEALYGDPAPDFRHLTRK